MIEYFIQLLLHSSWQILVLTGIVWPLSRLSLKSYPNFAYLLWTIILLRALVPFHIELPISSFAMVTGSEIISGQFLLESTVKSSESLTGFNLLKYLWIVGASALFLRLALNELLHRRSLAGATYVKMQGWMRTMQEELGVRRRVQLYLSQQVSSPMVRGLLNIRIYLPASFESWSWDEQRNVIAHELVHVKRNDLLIIYLQSLVRILYFFHPGIWLVNDQIDLEREKITDDEAIRVSKSSRQQYGEQLFNQLKRSQESQATPILAGGFFMTDSSVIKRFKYIKEKRNEMKNSLRGYHLILITIVATTAILMACASANEQVVKKAQFEKQEQMEISFVEFEVAPKPINGMTALMKNLVYPEEERKNGVEGKAIVAVVIDEAGTVKAVSVESSSDSEALDQAAIEAIKITQWQAAKQGNKTVTAKVAVPFVFKLSEAKKDSAR